MNSFLNLHPLLKVSILTVVGAFLGTLSSTTAMPQTLADWKAAIMPALWAAFVAERLLLQQQAAKSLAASLVAPGQPGTPPALPAPAAAPIGFVPPPAAPAAPPAGAK